MFLHSKVEFGLYLFYGTNAGEILDDNVRIFNVVPITNPVVLDMPKLEPFDGKNYKMWFDKKECFLGQLG